MTVLWLKVGGFCFLCGGHLLKGQGGVVVGRRDKLKVLRRQEDLNSHCGEQKEQENSCISWQFES